MALLFIDTNGGVYRADINTGQTVQLADYTYQWTDIAVTPDGRVFATTFNGLYELNVNRATAILRSPVAYGTNALASDINGNLYLAGTSENEINVISSKNFESVRTIELPFGTRSAGDIHINGNSLYYATSERDLLTVNLNKDSVVDYVHHGVNSLYGLHSEGGKIYGLAGNDIYLLNPKSGSVEWIREIPANITINGSATLAGVKIVGTRGDDVLQADENGSKLFGLAGNDILVGSRLADKMNGGAGDDYLNGRGGTDVLVGGNGNDILQGGGGNDRLLGNAGRDSLFGGVGKDSLYGGAGRDILEGGKGNDILSGGANADVFIFTKNDGRDRIVDFQDNIDVLEFDKAMLGGAPKNIDVLINRFAENTDDGVLFDFGARGQVLVANIDDKYDLADDVFLF